VAEEKELAEEGQPAEEVPEAAEETSASNLKEEAAEMPSDVSAPEEADATPVVLETGPSLTEEESVVEAPLVSEEPIPSGDEAWAEPVPPLAELDDLDRQADIYYYGTGRRKTASAQVRLYPSKEPAIIVNDKAMEQYFSRSSDILLLKRPLQVTATEGLFRITVKVRGGGITGQAGAVRHGIARALTKANPEFRGTLRREGSLTRDPRMKERKKPGLKRARKAPQYTKR
jgi:small subunit ribosomal protein S9